MFVPTHPLWELLCEFKGKHNNRVEHGLSATGMKDSGVIFPPVFQASHLFINYLFKFIWLFITNYLMEGSGCNNQIPSENHEISIHVNTVFCAHYLIVTITIAITFLIEKHNGFTEHIEKTFLFLRWVNSSHPRRRTTDLPTQLISLRTIHWRTLGLCLHWKYKPLLPPYYTLCIARLVFWWAGSIWQQS